MTFLYDWFSHNIPHWEKNLLHLKDKEINVLEIGCFEGRATLWLLENILTNKNSSITVIDTFEGGMENLDHQDNITNLYERFRENIKNYKNKVTIKKGYSYNFLRQYKPVEQFDFVYIDGSHMAKDVLEDVVLSWRLLKIGGILTFDDYKDWNYYEDPTLCPRLAIDSFLDVYKNQYELVDSYYQLTLKKLGDTLVVNTKRAIKQTPIQKTNNAIPSTQLQERIVTLETDLKKIQSSKFYKLWQGFNKLKKYLTKHE